MDEALQDESARSGRSKAALIRECIAVRFGDTMASERDPLSDLVGSVDVEPGDIDEVVYG